MSDQLDLIDHILRNGELLGFFFFLLWKKSNEFDDSQQTRLVHHDAKGFIIPDTVVLHHSRPMHWYFTAKDGSIKMKSRKNLTTENILQHFTRHGRSVGGCCAQFVRQDEASPDGIHITYVSASDLPGFMSANCYPGLLQLFLDPKQESGEVHNNEVVSSWTQNVFYVERRLNSARLANEKIDLADRCTTAETGALVKSSPLVSNHTLSLLETTNKLIANHIELVFRVRVSSLRIHCKVDPHDRVIILHCAALRVVDPRSSNSYSLSLEPVSLRAGAVSAPSPKKKLTSSSETATTSSVARSSTSLSRAVPTGPCVFCQAEPPPPPAVSCFNRVRQRHVLFPLSVIQFYQSHSHKEPFVDEVWDPETATAPPAHMLLLYPQMSVAEYSTLRFDNVWLNEYVTMCPRCAAGIAAVTANIHIGPDGLIRDPRAFESVRVTKKNRLPSTATSPTPSPAKPHHLPPISSSPVPSS